MRIIGVLDLMGGVVVRGVAGQRENYRPLVSQLCSSAQPEDVAWALIEKLGVEELYVADLDAIAGKEPAWKVYEALQWTEANLWIDAGVRTVDRGMDLAQFATVVVGLETVEGWDVVTRLATRLDQNMVFSLDLRNGEPLGNRLDWGTTDAWGLATLVLRHGVRRMLVLDLARVGVGEGTGTEALCARLAAEHPEVEVYTGGGVRGPDDLTRLRGCGVTAVLVASALHDGRLTREDVRSG